MAEPATRRDPSPLEAALERVVSRKLLPKEITDEVRAELFVIREEILKLMQEFRSQ